MLTLLPKRNILQHIPPTLNFKMCFCIFKTFAKRVWLIQLECTVCHPHTRSRLQVPPMLVKMYKKVDQKERLSYHAGCQEVRRFCTRGESQESIAYRSESTKVKHPPYFETLNRCHWKSKNRGISGPPKTFVKKVRKHVSKELSYE